MNVDIEKLYFECYIDMTRLTYKWYKVTWYWAENHTLSLEGNITHLKQLRLTETYFKTLGTNVSV